MPRFGIAGYPPAYKRSAFRKDPMRICQWLDSIGLDALELQMTYGPRISERKCREYRKEAEDWGIKLSVHASYFIVFTSGDPVKLANSRETLKRTFELADLLGSDAIILHPGSLYRSTDPSAVVDRFTENIAAPLESIGPGPIGLFVETAGKVGQLGSVDEILEISSRLPGVFPCIDFGHVHARTLGSLRSGAGIYQLFDDLRGRGCFEPGRRIHFHYTPIAYGPRGEVSHKAIHDRNPPVAGGAEGELYDPRYEPVAAGLFKWKVEATLISETKDSQEEGALALRKVYDSLAG